MGKTNTIGLDEHLEEFIQSEIRSGRYNSASEVVRSALRYLQNEELKLNKLREALVTGENSRWIENLDSDKLLIEFNKRHFQKKH